MIRGWCKGHCCLRCSAECKSCVQVLGFIQLVCVMVIILTKCKKRYCVINKLIYCWLFAKFRDAGYCGGYAVQAGWEEGKPLLVGGG